MLFNVLAVAMVVWSIQLLRSVKEESLLLCTDLGIQLTRRPFIGSAQSVFVEHHKVEDVILNEGITFAAVQTYLAFIMRVSFDEPRAPSSIGIKCGARPATAGQRNHDRGLQRPRRLARRPHQHPPPRPRRHV